MSEPSMDAGTLANAYLGMAHLFSYPHPQAWQRLVDHGLIDPALDQEVLAADYLAAFELGRGKTAVPLYEGMHRGDLGREGVLEDLLRFYEYFDAKLSETDREYPDHLVAELEFLAWLCLQEQTAERNGGDAESFRCAARDFLSRHLAAWLPEFRRRLEATGTAYAQYGSALGELVDAHRSRLGEPLQESGAMQ